jgi:hypothetical protein
VLLYRSWAVRDPLRLWRCVSQFFGGHILTDLEWSPDRIYVVFGFDQRLNALRRALTEMLRTRVFANGRNHD